MKLAQEFFERVNNACNARNFEKAVDLLHDETELKPARADIAEDARSAINAFMKSNGSSETKKLKVMLVRAFSDVNFDRHITRALLVIHKMKREALERRVAELEKKINSMHAGKDSR